MKPNSMKLNPTVVNSFYIHTNKMYFSTPGYTPIYTQSKPILHPKHLRLWLSHTCSSISDLNTEVGRLDGEFKKTSEKIELRRKQFQLLMHSINELQAVMAGTYCTFHIALNTHLHPHIYPSNTHKHTKKHVLN